MALSAWTRTRLFLHGIDPERCGANRSSAAESSTGALQLTKTNIPARPDLVRELDTVDFIDAALINYDTLWAALRQTNTVSGAQNIVDQTILAVLEDEGLTFRKC